MFISTIKNSPEASNNNDRHDSLICPSPFILLGNILHLFNALILQLNQQMWDCYFCQVRAVTKSRQAAGHRRRWTADHGGLVRGPPLWRQTKRTLSIVSQMENIGNKGFPHHPRVPFDLSVRSVDHLVTSGSVRPGPGDTSTCQQPVTSTLASSKHQDIIQRVITHSSVSGQGYTQ